MRFHFKTIDAFSTLPPNWLIITFLAHLSASEGHLDCLKLLVYYNNTPLIILKARNNKVYMHNI